MRVRLSLTLGAASTFGCAAAPPSPLPPAAPTPAPVARTTAPPSTPAAAPAPLLAFERVKPAGPPACVLDAEPWLPDDDDATLSLRPHGTPFVRVAVAAARVEIPVGKAGDVFVGMSGLGWNVAGHLAAESFTVHPTALVEHEGYLLPSELAKLELDTALESKLLVKVPLPPLLEPVVPPAPALYNCKEVGVGPPQPLDAEGELSVDPDARVAGFLRKGEFALSADPGGYPVAWLKTGAEESVLVLQQKGPTVQIALVDFTTLVYGWVRRAAVRIPKPKREEWGVGGLGLSGSGRLEKPPPAVKAPPVTRYRCETDLELLATAGSETLDVGMIDPGTIVTAQQSSGELVELVPPEWLHLVAGATFQVPAPALAKCKVADGTPGL